MIINYVGKLRQWHLPQIVHILWDDHLRSCHYSQMHNCQFLFSHSPALLIVYSIKHQKITDANQIKLLKRHYESDVSASFMNVCGQCFTEIASSYVDVCAWIKKLNTFFHYYFTNVSSWKKATFKNIPFMITFHGKTVTSRANKKAFLPSTSNNMSTSASELREEKRIK